ncbi:uncharacterized protein ACWYII_047385 isoform 1-T1 [Salvelinus alpinus]
MLLHGRDWLTCTRRRNGTVESLMHSRLVPALSDLLSHSLSLPVYESGDTGGVWGGEDSGLSGGHPSHVAHPDFHAMMADFLQFLLLRKPSDVIMFACEDFSPGGPLQHLFTLRTHCGFLSKALYFGL